jgi:hypothetical protein
MGVLSDLVVAPAGDAERVAHAEVPSQAFGGIDIKGIDSVKFGTLHSIVTGRPFEELLSEYGPVVTVSEEGPWVFEIPPELSSRLAHFDDAERAKVAKLWASTEEFALDGWAEDDVAAALGSISTLARRAVDSGQVLFLWMCL